MFSGFFAYSLRVMLYREMVDMILILSIGNKIARNDVDAPIHTALDAFVGTVKGANASGLADAKSNADISLTSVSTNADVLSCNAIAVANTADVVSSYITTGAVTISGTALTPALQSVSGADTARRATSSADTGAN